MDFESNQPLDLSKIPNPRVVFYYNQQPIDYYEYQRMVVEAQLIQNSALNYSSTPSPEHNRKESIYSDCVLENTIKVDYSQIKSPDYSKDFGNQSNVSSQRSEILDQLAEEDCDLNKTFVISKKRPSKDDKIKKKGNTSIEKRKRYSSKLLADYDLTIEEDPEVSLFTNNAATRSPFLNKSSSSSSPNMGPRDSPLTVSAKQEQAQLERINGTESLLDGMVYHENMARKYPDADNRTPEQAEHRRKNSQAARLSRARSKAIDQQRDVVAARTRKENVINKKTIAALCLYANKLNKLLHREQVDWIGKWKRINERATTKVQK